MYPSGRSERDPGTSSTTLRHATMAEPTSSPLMDQSYRESESHIESTDHYLNQVSLANL